MLIYPDKKTDCRMEVYSADGVREMCGNGVACVAKYVVDHGLVETNVTNQVLIETDAGPREVKVQRTANKSVISASVNMGKPYLKKKEIPFADGSDGNDVAIGVPVKLDGYTFEITCVSMGSPHAVVKLDQVFDLNDFEVSRWGPKFEKHYWFPQRINTSFICVKSRKEIDMRVWERGSGEAMASGSGACAAVVASVLNEWTELEVTVHVEGGDLRVKWDQETDLVWITGPVTEVY